MDQGYLSILMNSKTNLNGARWKKFCVREWIRHESKTY